MTLKLECYRGVIIVRPIGWFKRRAQGFDNRPDARRFLELMKAGRLNLVALP